MTCDDLLMRERPEEIVRGVGIFRDLLQPKRVLIGIEDNKPEAVAAMRAAVQKVGESFDVIAVPTRYPAGGAKQLIRVLTGKEVPASKRSPEMGVQCFNVATAYTAWRAIAHGEPVLSRIITVTGNVERPRNWEVLIGTPLKDVLALGQPKADSDRYLMGGPMMGFELPSLDAPMVKATNCIIAGSPKLFPPGAPEMPCIRCGACAEVCPHELQPFEMYWFARAQLRQDAGIQHLRLHRMRLLQLRLPVAHSAGAVLPLRQERDLVARTRKEHGRRREDPLRGAQRAREGRESRAPGQGCGGQGRRKSGAACGRRGNGRRRRDDGRRSRQESGDRRRHRTRPRATRSRSAEKHRRAERSPAPGNRGDRSAPGAVERTLTCP